MSVVDFPQRRIVRRPRNPADHIAVASRHDLKHELDGMRSMLGLMWGAATLAKIKRIECNSKASPAFNVWLRQEGEHSTAGIAHSVAAAACRVFGGHNGITVYGPAGESVSLDPEWPRPAA